MTAGKISTQLSTRWTKICQDSFGCWIIGFYLLHNIVVCLWLLVVGHGQVLGLLVAIFAFLSAGMTIIALVSGNESIWRRLASGSFYFQFAAGLLLTLASIWPSGLSAANIGFLLPGIGCLIWGCAALLMVIMAGG